MPHVLISPDLYLDETLHGCLRRWGWTCEQWSCGTAQEAGQGSRRDPHALIVSTQAAKQSGLLKSPGEAAGTAGTIRTVRTIRTQTPAPVLVLGEPDPAQAGGICLPDYGHEGFRLRGALDACLALAEPQGRPVPDGSVGVDMLDILGHELRTPLTAIKTALEVLAADLAADFGADLGADLTAAPQDGWTERPQDDNRVRMVQIALRNVQRLDRTVDWGQAMLRGDGGCDGSDAGRDADALSQPEGMLAPCPS